MPFVTRMENGQFAVALEITPPKKALPGILRRRAQLLGDSIQAVNVIQRPGRLSSLDASIVLRGVGLNPAWHLVNRGSTRAELRADLERARAAGIRQVLCIRGDHEADDNADTPKLREVVAMVHEAMPEAAIGATLNQYAPRPEAVFRNLSPKIEAGARYVQTQPVFDIAHLRPTAKLLRERHPGTKIVAMAMPLLGASDAQRIGQRLGFVLPDAIERRIEAGPDAAWELFSETMASLAESNLVDGVAIMTFEMDPSPETAARIVDSLRAAGVVEAHV